jgi:DNA-binding beta-propeller fold protein YncE
VYATGTITMSPAKQNMATVAYDAVTGTVRWSRRYGGRAHQPSAGNAVALSPDGSMLYAAGYRSTAAGKDLAVVAYDGSTGATQWSGRYDGPGHADDWAISVATSPDGRHVYASGQAYAAHDWGLATIAWDASGTKEWTRTYIGKRKQLNAAADMAVSPDGARVYVAGSSRGHLTAMDWTTLAYDAATGVTAWATHFIGPVSNDNAHAIDVSPDGSTVFVAGQSTNQGAGFDFKTIAYSSS